jgi:hypothetical protein
MIHLTTYNGQPVRITYESDGSQPIPLITITDIEWNGQDVTELLRSPWTWDEIYQHLKTQTT